MYLPSLTSSILTLLYWIRAFLCIALREMCAGAHLVTVLTANWHSSVLEQLQSCHREKNNSTCLKYIRPTSNVLQRNDLQN